MASVMGYCEAGRHIYARSDKDKSKDCSKHRKAASKGGMKMFDQDDYGGKKPWKGKGKR